jgi:hypothetical protein
MKRSHPLREWSPEERAAHRAIRERFRDWHPGPHELLNSGAARFVNADGELFDLSQAVQLLKESRAARRLSLNEVAVQLSLNLDVARLLESDQALNRPIEELYRYASALGVKLQLVLIDSAA